MKIQATAAPVGAVAPIRGLNHVINVHELAIGCCVQSWTTLRPRKPGLRPDLDILHTSTKRHSALRVVRAQSSYSSIETDREQPATMSTSILASLAPSTSALVNVGAAIFLIAVALFGISYYETLTSCECPIACIAERACLPLFTSADVWVS